MIRRIKQLSFSTVAVILLLSVIGGAVFVRTLRSEISNILASENKCSEIKRIVKDYDSEYENMIPRLGFVNTNIFRATGLINSNQVIGGKDDWLFYSAKNDGDPIADFMGTNSFSDDQLLAAKNNIVSIQESLKKKNISFCLLVPPNKETEYSEYMPLQEQKADVTRTDILVNYLIENSVNVAYPKEELKQFDPFYSYYKRDTHWNELGAYIGTQTAMKTMGVNLPILTEDSIKEGTKPSADLAKMAGINDAFPIDYGFTTDYVDNDVNEFHNVEHTELTHFHNNNAKYDSTILVVGDSFRLAMRPVLRYFFQDVYVVHRGKYEKGMIDTIMPEYVIFEFVERYSGNMVSFNML